MKTDRKIKRSRQLKKLAAAFLIAGLSVFSQLPAAHALPGGGNVVTMPGLGTADISNDTLNDMRVAITGNGAIINWDSFSIDTGESVSFNMDPNVVAVLNRVTGADISQINGFLTASSSIVLVNPNGIVFGQGTQLNLPVFIVSTIDIDDANFKSFIDGGTTTLAFDKPGVGGAINVIGDITGMAMAVSFIAPTINLAANVTLSADLSLNAADKVSVEVNPDQTSYTSQISAAAGTVNTLAVNGDIAANSINVYGGEIIIGPGSDLSSDDYGRVSLEAVTRLGRNTSPYPSQGEEATVSSAPGNTITVNAGATLTAPHIVLSGNSIKIEGEVASTRFMDIYAADIRQVSDSNGDLGANYFEFSSGNKVEIGATGKVSAADETLLYADTVDNKGTYTRGGGWTQIFGAAEVIGIPGAFSGKNHTTDGEEVNVGGNTITVKINDPSHPKTRLDQGFTPSEGGEASGYGVLYLKVPTNPTDPTDPTDPVIPPVDENTGNSEVIQAAEDAIKSAASDGAALKVIEGVFNNIKDKSDADKTEIIVGVIYAAAQEGLDQKDVTQAIVNGSKGEGAFNANLSDAGNETARQTEPKAELRPDSSAGQTTAAGQGNNVQPDITPGQGVYQEQPVTIEGENALL